MRNERRCLNCGTILHGRPDKVFCCKRCKDTWHNMDRRRIKSNRSTVQALLDNKYTILICLMKSMNTSWTASLLKSIGFKRDYFTRLVEHNRGQMVCECFNLRYCVSKTKLWGLETMSSAGREEPQTSSPSRSYKSAPVIRTETNCPGNVSRSVPDGAETIISPSTSGLSY